MNELNIWLRVRYSQKSRVNKWQWGVIKEVQNELLQRPYADEAFDCEIRKLAALEEGRLTATIDSMLSSLMHMHLNRWGIHGDYEAHMLCSFVCTLASQSEWRATTLK